MEVEREGDVEAGEEEEEEEDGVFGFFSIAWDASNSQENIVKSFSTDLIISLCTDV